MTVELKPETIEHLRMLADVRKEGLFFPAGNVLRTESEAHHLYAEVETEETFPFDFALYDSKRFVDLLHIIDKPILHLEATQLRVTRSAGGVVAYYPYCAATLVSAPLARALPSVDVEFKLERSQFEQFRSIANLTANEVVLVADGKTMHIEARHSESVPASKTCELELGDVPGGQTFSFVWNLDCFKPLIDDNYSVAITKYGLSRFTPANRKIRYQISLEKSSEYEGKPLPETKL